MALNKSLEVTILYMSHFQEYLTTLTREKEKFKTKFSSKHISKTYQNYFLKIVKSNYDGEFMDEITSII